MDKYNNEEFTFWNTLNYIKDNYVQFLLLLLVFIIIYIVDHISNINAMIFTMPSPIIGVKNLQHNKNSQPTNIFKNRKPSKK
jgi:hypothetical protein